ncbi:Hydroxyethylthiazole kinase [invertebrate metagenome]|uniref:hydroxyethylthiazole kinase n=1 Tax=invertebrate metagenome TaxID=1711999 RepID=A0A2H9T8C7_9ZZZZ
MALDITTCLDNLRSRQPLVHNITNLVVMNVTANALLAIGASPIMAHAIEEVADMVSLSDSLVINTGTITEGRFHSMMRAVKQARQLKKPWVLDPVGAGATAFRLEANRQLLAVGPSVVRGNASEIMALFKGEAGGKGVDSSSSSDTTLDIIREQAELKGMTIAVTGATDYVTDGKQLAKLTNGHPMMSRVTGTGCTATALIGAFLATSSTAFEATVSALACLGISGERAAVECPGPGTLQVRLLDELYGLNAQCIKEYLRLEMI